MKRVVLWVLGSVSALAATGCQDPIRPPYEQCGLVCPDKGIAQGNSVISGVADIDAFFGAVVDTMSASASVRAGIQADLDAIALSLGLPQGTAGADIANALSQKISATTESGLELVFEEPVCRASIDAAVGAAAECDADVDPGSATVGCEGSCRADASAMVDCGANAQLACEGTAPSFQCAGTCSGDCELTMSVACDGVCRGVCTGMCSVMDTQGNCAGECIGTCQGTCELTAGGTCNGECRGTCHWQPGGNSCDAGATASCEADAGVSIQCDTSCEGTTKPPMVSAECEAAVQAKADASVECIPPRVTARWQWAAGVNATEQAEFRAWLEGVSAHAASMMSKGVKGDIIINGFTNMSEAADGAFRDGLDAAAKGDLKAKIGAGCAIGELPDAITLMGDETTELFDSLQQASQVLAVFD